MIDLSYKRYLRSIRRYTPLTPDQERELGLAILQGSKTALDKLVTHNVLFVVSVAKRYTGQGVPLIDLISSGNEGLIKAAHRFDWRKNMKFISYAVWWIRRYMLIALANSSRHFRLPHQAVTSIGVISKFKSTFENTNHRLPTFEEISDGTGLSYEEVQIFEQATTPVLSLDYPIHEDGVLLHETISEDTGDPDFVSRQQIQSLIDTCDLTEKEHEAIVYWLGWDGIEGRTQFDVAVKMGVSKARIIELIAAVKRKLKDYVETHDLVYDF